MHLPAALQVDGWVYVLPVQVWLAQTVPAG